MKEKLKKLFHRPLGVALIALFACVVCSFSACLVNTGGFQYSVKQVTVDMDDFYTKEYAEAAKKPTRMTIGEKKDGMVNAKLTGNLYLPKNVSESNPAPAVLLTHGYLNSKEFEEAPAIEMARRGYVVFAFDQYDHGDSTWDTPSQFNFYVWSMYDAVEYMYSQNYVLKDSAGNGMISVSGHSMGGFSSELAVAWDEMNYAMNGVHTYRQIAACLAVGADFRYDDAYVKGYSGGTYATTYMTYNSRTCGTISGQYDEFFFNNTQGTHQVIEKDYASDSVGYAMLGLTSAGEAGKWYAVDPSTNTAYAETPATPGYGERIIYEVAGDHPYNTWSPQATECMISFYDHAFNYQQKLHGLTTASGATTWNATAKSGQIWWLKEVFTCLGLIATVVCMIAASAELVRLPLLKKVKTEEADVPEVVPNSKPRKLIAGILSVFAILASGWLVPAFMDRSTTEGLTWVSTICHVFMYTALGIGVIALVISIILGVKGGEKSESAKKVLGKTAVGATVIGFLSLVLNWVVTDGTSRIASGAKYWSAPSVNTIVYWAIASGLFGLILSLITHFVINKDRTIGHLGLKANVKQIGIAFLVGCVVATFAYLIILLSTVIFGVDFRVYTYAFNAITGPQFVAGLKYLPLFFVFYLASGIQIASATAGKKGWKADVIAATILALPSVLFLAYQYGTLLTTGTAAWSDFALSGILVQGLVLTLVFAGVIQRRTLEKTGNIWTGVFTNTLWFTMITMASTTVYNLQ